MGKKPTGNPPGRPSSYDEAVAMEFCNRLASGRTMRDVCSDPDMPGLASIREWRWKRPEFANAVVRASEDRLEETRAKLVEMAADVLKPDGTDPNRVNAAAHALAKAEQLSGRMKMEVTGGNGGPIQTKDVSDLDAARAVAFLLAAGARAVPDTTKG